MASMLIGSREGVVTFALASEAVKTKLSELRISF
jgi:hypothetical protein